MQKSRAQSLILALLFALAPSSVFAVDAVMEVSPSVGTFHVYDEVEIVVRVTSGEEAVSAVEGRLSYNPKELVVTHVITDDTIVSSWTQKPFVDKEVGEIVFGGALPKPATLTGAKIFTLRVRPERAGDTHLRFEGGAAIISADGLGSNILTSFKSGAYRVLPEELNLELSVPNAPVVENIAGVAQAGGEVLGVATATPHTEGEMPPTEEATVVASSTPPQSTFMPAEEDLPTQSMGTLDAPPPEVVDEGFFMRHPSLPFVALLFALLIIFSVRIFRTMAREAIEAEAPLEEVAPQSSAQIILSPRIRN